MTNPILDCARDGKVHTINSFLQRPINFRTANWSTESAGTRLASFSFPSDVVKIDMYKRKLERFLGLRADLEVRVQVNAQPFHAGRLMLSWTPFHGKLGIQRDDSYVNPALPYLTCITGNPRVEIDLSTTTEATMTIPFVSPFLYYNLITGTGDIGRFQLIVYSPLVDLVSGGNINYTIWLRLVNVQTEFPTGMPMSVAQIGEEADRQAKRGFVTRQSEAYSTILEPFTAIPVIGNVVSMAKVGVDALYGLANINGWSKPHNAADTQVFKNAPARYMCNADGSDTATNLGLAARNELEQFQEVFRTDADEMNITYVAKTPNFVGRFNWLKGDTPGKIIYSRVVSPVSWFNTFGSTGMTIPHMAFVATNFAMWRGGINVTLKFVKTKFHSGRVRIIYVPGLFNTTQPTDFLTDANYSTVVDLRSDTDVLFNIPYVAIVPWLRVKEEFWAGNQDQTYATGCLFVEVLNELVNTSTVSNTIEVLVEVSAAEDLEFAIPTIPHLSVRGVPSNARVPLPRLNPSRQSPLSRIRSVAQVGTEEGDTPLEIARERPTDFNEVALQPKHTTFNVSMITMGEKIASLRQLVKRFSVLRPSDQTDIWQIQDHFQINTNKFVGYTSEEGSVATDTLSWIASIYAFYRGSTRYKIVPYGDTNKYGIKVILKPSLNYDTGDAIIVATSNGPRTSQWGGEANIPSIEGVYELSVPYYSPYPATLTTLNSSTSNIIDAEHGYNKVFVTKTGPGVADYYIYRAAADDFSFGFLLGVPAINHTSA